MKKKISSLLILLLLAGLGGRAVAGSEASDLSAAERDELQAQLDEARMQLDEAAHKLGELHSRLYSLETVGDPGQKPMLGVLIGERGPNGGLLLAGVTPGGGAAAAGLMAGDEMTTVNDADLTNTPSPMSVLKEAMSGVAPGEVVAVGYLRGGSSELVGITTQAKGTYIMSMIGAPSVHVDVQALEDMAHGMSRHFSDVTINEAWAGSLENLESLEALQALGEIAPQVHGAIRLNAAPVGLRLEQVEGDLAGYFGVDSGVLVLAVPPTTEAAASDLRAGDVLLAIDGEPIVSPGDGYRALSGSQHSAGASAQPRSVELLRHGSRLVVQVLPSELGGGHQTITILRGGPEDLDIRVIAPDSP